MYSFHWNLGRNRGMIVHDERNRGSGCNFVNFSGKMGKLIHRFFLAPKLNEIDPAFYHFFSYSKDIQDIDVAQIQDPIEPCVC